ncbi:MAG: M15 family metallopeptidase [Chthoniobacterales bacterium]|nr:M15 family metallopeptidase [Chthoniobacterales bacterium]
MARRTRFLHAAAAVGLGLASLGAATPAPTAPASGSSSARFDFHGDVPAFLRSLPDSLGNKAQLSAIVSALATAYPKEFQGLETGPGNRVMVRAAGGKFVFDDSLSKTFEERLDHPDIEDMFHDLYPLTNPTDRLPRDFDPGRVRVEDFFLALYGASESAVAANCVEVDFCGSSVKFNKRCGAADALRAVAVDLEKVFAQKPALRVYVQKLAGTFNWRKIAGTKRLSNHSFGTAIDLNLDKAAYWRWQKPEQLETFSRKDWPNEIVEAFERHGFIWGGKWWHFDTMHFEYRPEIIAYARDKGPTVAPR